MTTNDIPISYDDSSTYLVRSTENVAGALIQWIQLCDDSTTNPTLINPASETTLSDINGHISTIDTAVGTVNTNIGTTNTKLDTLNAQLATMSTAPETAQLSITDTQVTITAGMSGRKVLAITNMEDLTSGTNVIYVGKTGVTKTTGYPLRAGRELYVDSSAVWYGICDTGLTATLGVMESK